MTFATVWPIRFPASGNFLSNARFAVCVKTKQRRERERERERENEEEQPIQFSGHLNYKAKFFRLHILER